MLALSLILPYTSSVDILINFPENFFFFTKKLIWSINFKLLKIFCLIKLTGLSIDLST